MGANDFSATALGATADHAFDKAIEDALYEYGHGGYTGTIAEKSRYTLVDLKALGMTRAAFHKALEAVEEAGYAQQDAEFTACRGSTDAAKFANRAKRLRAKAAKLAKGNDAAIARWSQAANDKWGPAIAVEVTGNAAKIWRVAHGLTGRRGKVFEFFGTASS